MVSEKSLRTTKSPQEGIIQGINPTIDRSLRALLVATAFVALAPCATASAKTVTYKSIVSPTGHYGCFAVKYGPPGEIECSGRSLPDIGDLDSYLALRPHGRSRISERGDYPGYNVRRRRLHYGDTWKRPGIRCTMRKTGLTCRNRDDHGFHLQTGHVRRF
jgi:hypothetical protein